MLFHIALYGPFIGCLLLGVLLQRVSWANILVIIEVTLTTGMMGIISGLFDEKYIGRKKGWGSNLKGIALVGVVIALPFLLIQNLTIAAYFPIDNFGKVIGFSLFFFSFGETIQLGRSLARRTRIFQPRSSQ